MMVDTKVVAREPQSVMQLYILVRKGRMSDVSGGVSVEEKREGVDVVVQ